MRLYIYIGLAVTVLLGAGWWSVKLYNAGKDSVVEKLKDDKITILKEGRKIDENVLSTDDDGLTCILLDNCPSDKPL